MARHQGLPTLRRTACCSAAALLAAQSWLVACLTAHFAIAVLEADLTLQRNHATEAVLERLLSTGQLVQTSSSCRTDCTLASLQVATTCIGSEGMRASDYEDGGVCQEGQDGAAGMEPGEAWGGAGGSMTADAFVAQAAELYTDQAAWQRSQQTGKGVAQPDVPIDRGTWPTLRHHCCIAGHACGTARFRGTRERSCPCTVLQGWTCCGGVSTVTHAWKQWRCDKELQNSKPDPLLVPVVVMQAAMLLLCTLCSPVLTARVYPV